MAQAVRMHHNMKTLCEHFFISLNSLLVYWIVYDIFAAKQNVLQNFLPSSNDSCEQNGIFSSPKPNCSFFSALNQDTSVFGCLAFATANWNVKWTLVRRDQVFNYIFKTCCKRRERKRLETEHEHNPFEYLSLSELVFLMCLHWKNVFGNVLQDKSIDAHGNHVLKHAIRLAADRTRKGWLYTLSMDVFVVIFRYFWKSLNTCLTNR